MTIRAALLWLSTCCLTYGLTAAPWDFEKAYEHNTDVFVGKVIKAERGLDIDSGITAATNEDQQPVKVLWTNATKYTVTPVESFKGEQAEKIELIDYGFDQRFETLNGDAVSQKSVTPEIAFPNPPRPRLIEGESYLIFLQLNQNGFPTVVRYSNVQAIVDMDRELEILYSLQFDPKITTFSSAVMAYETRKEQIEQEERRIQNAIEDRFHSILNKSTDYAERKKGLQALIKDLGFEGMRPETRSPSPDWSKVYATKDRIWDKASQEIVKINMILEARKATRKDAE